MSGERRAALKAAVDERVRQLNGDVAELRDYGRCAGCGMPYDEKTPGCDTCWNRHRNRSDTRRLQEQKRYRNRPEVAARRKEQARAYFQLRQNRRAA